MQELAHPGQGLPPGGLLLEKVLHRLDVVVGGCLDGLDRPGVLLGKVVDDAAQVGPVLITETRHLGNAGFHREVDQPLHFHPHAGMDQAVLAEDATQRRGLVGVAAVEGRQRSEFRKRQGLISHVTRGVSGAANNSIAAFARRSVTSPGGPQSCAERMIPPPMQISSL